MPKSAAHTGMVDLELTPQEIADELARIDRLELEDNRGIEKHARTFTSDPYQDILKLLGDQTGVRFDQYKQNTIRRRVERRVAATNSRSVAEYASYLSENPPEGRNLLQDVLISVTSFFRDADAFAKLADSVTHYMKKKSKQRSFRCWIVGCATGEEAYSLAIVLCEALDKLKLDFRPQIFATDLDGAALEIARKGVYPESAFLDFPPAWKAKYFSPKDDRFQVKPELRDMVIFALHNIAEDPPFLDIDLLSCRNVMIYFNSELQERVLSTFQYALVKDALLFLGRSETVPSGNRHFDVLDKIHRIYRRNDVKDVARTAIRRDIRIEPNAGATRRKPSPEEAYFHSLLANLAPNSVIVDDEFHVKQVFGQAGSFLSIPPGKSTHELIKLLHPSLSFELSSLLRLAQKNSAATHGRTHSVKIQGKKVNLKLSVAPLQADGRTEYLVTFSIEKKTKANAQVVADARIPKNQVNQKLRLELLAAREHLQSVIEEQETSNEELQALNEELQSANEELQSTNEELETTNEELQSTNEELITLNEEVNAKGAELLSANLELQATQNAISYPIFVLDRKKNLVRFNNAARFLFRLSEGDLGTGFPTSLNSIDFLPVIRLVDQAIKKNGEAIERFQTLNRCFDVQAQVMRNAKNEVDGVVLSFVEITEIVTVLEEARVNRERLSSILENTLAVVCMKDVSGVYIYANRKFYEVTGTDEKSVIGRTDEEIFGPQVGHKMRDNDLKVMNRKNALQSDEYHTIGGVDINWESSRFPLFDRQGRIQSVCTVAVDISRRIADQRTIANQQDELSRHGKYSAIAEISAGIAHEVNTPLNVITTKTDLLRKMADKERLEPGAVKRLADDVDRMAKNISSIVHGLKSVANLDEEHAENTPIQKIVADALKICEFRIQRFGVELILDLPQSDAMVHCFPVQIIQVLINLVNNSLEAMMSLQSRWLRISLQETADFYCLRLTDAGTGIPEEIAEKIMTPFFTTKKEQQGTGIGLSLSRTIARRHGGELELDRKSKNTTFILSIPKAEAPRKERDDA